MPGHDGQLLVLFDGVCNLCNRTIAHIIRNDPSSQFRFAALQSDVARSLGEEFGFDARGTATIVLVEGGRFYMRSDAALRIARRLRGPSQLWRFARAVPRPLRDVIYDMVANNRYRWFGHRAECMIPEPGLAERFLDAGER